ncbi:MAG: hypothetical protein JOY71_31370 [Acetobacteraceae bacterium]|nr:hypothetical protein [Acetobacteraceae bacterium]MBV8592082.1 hypothetical protein [Acetobacteraceae bacterium]
MAWPATNVFGFVSDEVKAIHQRLRVLHRNGGAPKHLHLSLYGEYITRLTRADLTPAAEVAEKMITLAGI